MCVSIGDETCSADRQIIHHAIFPISVTLLTRLTFELLLYWLCVILRIPHTLCIWASNEPPLKKVQATHFAHMCMLKLKLCQQGLGCRAAPGEIYEVLGMLACSPVTGWGTDCALPHPSRHPFHSSCLKTYTHFYSTHTHGPPLTPQVWW